MGSLLLQPQTAVSAYLGLISVVCGALGKDQQLLVDQRFYSKAGRWGLILEMCMALSCSP